MNTKNFYRGLFYVVGLLILAMGIILNTKSGLGVSPIVSVPYSISTIWSLNFGDMTMVMYLILAIAEYLLKWNNFRMYDLLQIPLSFAFTRILNVFAAYLPSGVTIGQKVLCLVCGVICTGIGAAMSVNVRLVPNPGDGIVQAISDRVKKEMGFCKNCFDVGCVTTTVCIGMLAVHFPVGIGIGTLAAMIGVGRVMALFNHFFKKRMLELSGVEEFTPKVETAAS